MLLKGIVDAFFNVFPMQLRGSIHLKQVTINYFIVVNLVWVIIWCGIWNIKQKHLMSVDINDTGNKHKVGHKRACKITIKF